MAATLKTPGGLYRLVIYEQNAGWNCAVFGPENYKQFGVSSEEALTYAAAADLIHDFCLEMERYYNEQTYAAAA